MFSVAPAGAWFGLLDCPTADAVGYLLAPLRGYKTMTWIVQNLWLIPALPLLAAGISALLKQRERAAAATLAIGAMGIAFVLSCAAFVHTLGGHGAVVHHTVNFDWFQIGATTLKLGWILDPLTAAMLVMVTFVGTLIFIYSVGYMAHDVNFTRFFCFLSLFAAAMLGLVIANNLLLLFMCWELVGLASYLLICFWYHKPSAAAAAKKAFITTRIGDVGFFLGILWLYAETGTLLFYDNGHGCLEASALTKLVSLTVGGGMAVSTAVSLLLFCGAVGKSGQLPLHVWLPDAMEGPTPVSALIHAATMVAAGVFMLARVYPLLEVDPLGVAGHSTALSVVTWVGALTAFFAASVAVAQNDIKRILAYSTVSQLGFMMVGLGTGGVAVGMLHLITHAFFKALLFLGAGSVIHGCHEEQDIRKMGGLRALMPKTFATYAIGMMALSGFPFLFSGFWSKDEILHSALHWDVSHGPFYLVAMGAMLTAFYMSRQMCYVFFGKYRGAMQTAATNANANANTHESKSAKDEGKSGKAKKGQQAKASHAQSHASAYHLAEHGPHESPDVMTIPLVLLAAFTILLAFVATPVWPWFHSYLTGHEAGVQIGELFAWEKLSVICLSILFVAVGVSVAWQLYWLKPIKRADDVDALEQLRPDVIGFLKQQCRVDEFYEATVVRFNAWAATTSDFLDRWIWGGVVKAVSLTVTGLAWAARFADEFGINLGFQKGCDGLMGSGGLLARMQSGRVHDYLRVIGLALAVLVLALVWGCRS